MTQLGDLLNRLTRAVAAGDPQQPLSARLCHSAAQIVGVEGVAVTVAYASASRVTLCATSPMAHRLEDLQDVLGEGPGHSAASSGRIETCTIPAPPGSSRWSVFVEAAQDLVERSVIHAVPMNPVEEVFGVLTLYQDLGGLRPLALGGPELQFLANVVGAALLGDSDTGLTDGPWASRAKIHQATGMVAAQMHISPDDALAVLRAHAYGQQATLSEIASALVERRIELPQP